MEGEKQKAFKAESVAKGDMVQPKILVWSISPNPYPSSKSNGFASIHPKNLPADSKPTGDGDVAHNKVLKQLKFGQSGFVNNICKDNPAPLRDSQFYSKGTVGAIQAAHFDDHLVALILSAVQVNGPDLTVIGPSRMQIAARLSDTELRNFNELIMGTLL